MADSLADQFASRYKGNIVYSASGQVQNIWVEVSSLNDLLVKVKFRIKGQEILFRAVASDQEEGLFLLIQERVTRNYILTGLAGWLYEKPYVHGGLISKLNSFFFHIYLDNFNGIGQEVYFIGKKEKDYLRSMEERRRKLQLL